MSPAPEERSFLANWIPAWLKDEKEVPVSLVKLARYALGLYLLGNLVLVAVKARDIGLLPSLSIPKSSNILAATLALAALYWRPSAEVGTRSLLVVFAVDTGTRLLVHLNARDTVTIPVVSIVYLLSFALLIPWRVRDQVVASIIIIAGIVAHGLLVGTPWAGPSVLGLLIAPMSIAICFATKSQRQLLLRNQEELRQSRSRHQQLVENIDQIVYRFDRNGVATYISPVVKEILGYEPDEIVGRNFAVLVHPDEVVPLARRYEAVIAGAPVPAGPFRFLDKAGNAHWMRNHGRHAREGGKIVAIEGSLSDITREKEAEEARVHASVLAETTEERLHGLASNLPGLAYQSVIHSNMSLELVSAVPTPYLVDFAITADELLRDSSRVYEFVLPEDVPLLAKAARQTLVDGEHDAVEFRVRTATGELRWLRNVATVRRRPDGGVDCFGLIIDVTELQEAKERAEAGELAKTLFLGNMSHEIRTPINAIVGAAEMLGRTTLTPSQNRYVDAILARARFLVSLTDDVLDQTRKEAGRETLRAEAVDLRDIVKLSIGLVDREAEHKGLELSWHIERDVPNFVVTDGTRLTQILMNLLTNAVKFTNEGKVEVILSWSPGRADGRGELHGAVRDTGIGIPAAYLNRLFRPFEQGNPEAAGGGSAGLGLATSKRTCELMGGEIWAESIVGEGSTFRFILPVEAVVQAVEEKPAANTWRHGALAERRSMRILLAEDDVFSRFVVSGMITELGYTCDVAENGEQVVQAVERQSFDAVLMDLHMPVMDGLEAAHAICEMLPPSERPWIIATTADVTGGKRRACRKAGMNDYLEKPVTLASLDSAIQRAVTRSVGEPPVAGEVAESLLHGTSQVVVDPTRLFATVRGEPSLLGPVMEAYFADALMRLQDIEAAVQADDAKRFEGAAHTLRGASALFGADEVADIARDLEVYVQRSGLCSPEIQKRSVELRAAVERLHAAVSQIAKERGCSPPPPLSKPNAH